ncbi:MAG: hypothetical protein KR126chlam5_00049 [Candidatus Anoxychlamydiales bacterium]|nr:hypothetical protein [Candidatus Anoxychlamydiales bacterium]
MPKKEFLERLQAERPLNNYRLKKDYLNIYEAIFIYYRIEPLDQQELYWKGITNEKIINCIDIEYIFEIIQDSDLLISPRRGVLLNDFIKFLKNKGFDIPEHLNKDLKKTINKHSYSEKQELLTYDLKKLSPNQLQRLTARGFAVYLWKKKKYKKTSANELVQKKDYKEAMKLINSEDISEETLASWISDLGPRSKKLKN